jgi:hypothetical protein
MRAVWFEEVCRGTEPGCRRGSTQSVFPDSNRTFYNEMRYSRYRGNPTMPLSGEAIRLMNLIDDVAVTLRRVLATVPTLTVEERVRVAEHLEKARPNAEDVAQALAIK